MNRWIENAYARLLIDNHITEDDPSLTLIATGLSSRFDMAGAKRPDFGLADVFGVTDTGGQAKRFHYVSLCDRAERVAAHAAGPLVRATSATVLGRICAPIFDPDDERYVSIHSNPPGQDSEFAGLTVNRFGQGTCVYLAPPLLSLQQDAQQVFATRLLREYGQTGVVPTTNAPPAVEITVLRSATERAWLVAAVNYQRELPNVPVYDLAVTVRLPEKGLPKTVRRISDGAAVSWREAAGALTFTLPRLDALEMVELTY